jgi:hypothetical protein
MGEEHAIVVGHAGRDRAHLAGRPARAALAPPPRAARSRARAIAAVAVAVAPSEAGAGWLSGDRKIMTWAPATGMLEP